MWHPTGGHHGRQSAQKRKEALQGAKGRGCLTVALTLVTCRVAGAVGAELGALAVARRARCADVRDAAAHGDTLLGGAGDADLAAKAATERVVTAGDVISMLVELSASRSSCQRWAADG